VLASHPTFEGARLALRTTSLWTLEDRRGVLGPLIELDDSGAIEQDVQITKSLRRKVRLNRDDAIAAVAAARR